MSKTAIIIYISHKLIIITKIRFGRLEYNSNKNILDCKQERGGWTSFFFSNKINEGKIE